MRIVVLSDTHVSRGLDDFGSVPTAHFASADVILHAGDVHAPRVLDSLEQFAPVVCARGNHDMFEDIRVSDVVFLESNGWRLGAKHQLDELRDRPNAAEALKRREFPDAQLDILIAGDTHFERLEYLDGTLIVNVGSALMPHNYTPRLGAIALFDIEPDYVEARIVQLGESAGLRNPSRTASITFDRSGVLAASFDGASAKFASNRVRWPTVSSSGLP